MAHFKNRLGIHNLEACLKRKRQTDLIKEEVIRGWCSHIFLIRFVIVTVCFSRLDLVSYNYHVVPCLAAVAIMLLHVFSFVVLSISATLALWSHRAITSVKFTLALPPSRFLLQSPDAPFFLTYHMAEKKIAYLFPVLLVRHWLDCAPAKTTSPEPPPPPPPFFFLPTRCGAFPTMTTKKS